MKLATGAKGQFTKCKTNNLGRSFLAEVVLIYQQKDEFFPYQASKLLILRY